MTDCIILCNVYFLYGFFVVYIGVYVFTVACLVYSVTLGVIRSLGILLVEMQEYYHISDATGMWILASTACMILIAGAFKA